MRLVILTCAVVATALAFSMRQELAASPAMWLGLCIPYALLAALAVYVLYEDGTLLERARFHWGDVSIGVVSAILLLCGAWLVRNVMFPPGSKETVWLFRLLLQLGNVQRAPLLAFVLLLLVLAEEVVWRGMVLDALTERFGSRIGWILAAFAYGSSHLPTLVTLSDPSAGANPLVVLAAFGCGLVWSFAAARLGRLPPVVISHLAFVYLAPPLMLSGW